MAPQGAAEPGSSPDHQYMVEQSEVGICITQDGVFRYVNPKYAELHGTTPQQLLGTAYADIVHPDDRERVAEIIRLRAEGRHRSAYESRNLRRDGSCFDSRVFGRSIDHQGRQANLVTTSDISELVQAHRVGAWRSRMLDSTELLCRSGSIEIDLPRRSARLSAGANLLLDTMPRADGSVSLLDLLRRLPASDRAEALAHWRQARPGQPFELHHRLRLPDGLELQVIHRGLVEAPDAHDSAPPRAVAILQDITEHTAAQRRIEQLSNYHPVTGLATRPLLLKRAAAAVELVSRDQRPLAMLYLRVAELDRVHDVLGLAAGDALATVVAQRLRACSRPEDTVAQLGGGEFAILLDPAAGPPADQDSAMNAATAVLAALEMPAVIDGTELFTRGRIGIALHPGDACDADELLAHAHAACGRGDSGIGFFRPDLGVLALRRIRLEAALYHALGRDEFRLHYQPQLDLRDGSVVGAEALLRWTNDEFGEVSPGEFVPIAEDIGLIVGIGEWVFRHACEQSAAWAAAGLPPLRLSVNLSPGQLALPDISQRLQAILVASGADPAHLTVEVTESVLTRDIDHARRTLNELSALGIEIALDDFGTGYSNLSVLRALPFDVLKIDRSLVHDVTAAPEDVSLTRAVLALAQGLKIKVLAEGVETEGQLSLLVSNGCDLMQGFIFSRPLPAAGMEALLREGRRLPDAWLNRSTDQRTLLLVDDEENVLSSLRRLLRRQGYRIVTARSGEEGLARLAEHEVDVIVSDQRMPGMTGVEFLRRAKELYPATVRIVLSGYTELQSITDAVNEGSIYKFLTKPWDDLQLVAHIEEAFHRKELTDLGERLDAELKRTNEELALAHQRQQDLLARQESQLSLEAGRARHAQELLENLPTAAIGIDPDGAIVFVNARARQLMGTQRPLVGLDAAQALPAAWLAGRHAGSRPRRIDLDGRACVLSFASMQERGELLSIVPEIDLETMPASHA